MKRLISILARSRMRDHVGVEALVGDFMSFSTGQHDFDIVTFNKVLEHVENPVAMLRHAASFPRPAVSYMSSFPMGNGALRQGSRRAIEHLHCL